MVQPDPERAGNRRFLPWATFAMSCVTAIFAGSAMLFSLSSPERPMGAAIGSGTVRPDNPTTIPAAPGTITTVSKKIAGDGRADASCPEGQGLISATVSDGFLHFTCMKPVERPR